jgi:hypothetical protein
MNRKAFDETLVLLTASGLKPRSHEYEEKVFGSWWIEVDGDPRLRIIWDGKNASVVVQRLATRTPPRRDEDAWEDRWVGRDRAEQTPARLVGETLALAQEGASP